jgi:hypothetical protein
MLAFLRSHHSPDASSIEVEKEEDPEAREATPASGGHLSRAIGSQGT